MPVVVSDTSPLFGQLGCPKGINLNSPGRNPGWAVGETHDPEGVE